MRRIRVLILIVFIALLIFTRFYNLPKTTRFTRDESSNLLDIHRIYVDRDLTLIGPIDSSLTIIYPSLTFYMLMPFAIVGNFTPQSPAYGTAFFGVLAVILMVLITRRVNKTLIYYIGALSIVWFPMVESARWAWNPHLVPFISFSALFLFLKNNKLAFLLSGIFLGLSFHLHYLTIASASVFVLIFLLENINQKKFINPILVGLGFLLTITPFIYFDLKNPPGLFFGKFVQNNLLRENSSIELANFWPNFFENMTKSIYYLAQTKLLGYLLGIVICVLIVRDIKTRSFKPFLYLTPVLAQTMVISFLPTFENRYFLLGLPFFVLWMILPRGNIENTLVKLAVIVMIVGSLLKLSDQLSKPIKEPAAGTVNEISNFIKDDIVKSERKNVNIAVLASPDLDPLGVIYRHTLKVKNVDLLLSNQFGITDNLFIVSTSDEYKIRNDQANVMNGFRGGVVKNSNKISGSDWRVYLFNKN